ncbi:MAG: hypothetical protein WC508_03155 [Patescibacteria group bacterium]
MLKRIVVLIISSLILSGCQNAVTKPIQDTADYVSGKVQIEQKKQADKTLAIMQCQELCQNRLSTDGKDFDRGPCLSEEIIPGWACDVAHSPRQSIDNEAANQCQSFGQGKVSHFVEVDGNCNVIKSY